MHTVHTQKLYLQNLYLLYMYAQIYLQQPNLIPLFRESMVEFTTTTEKSTFIEYLCIVYRRLWDIKTPMGHKDYYLLKGSSVSLKKTLGSKRQERQQNCIFKRSKSRKMILSKDKFDAVGINPYSITKRLWLMLCNATQE